MPYNEHEKDLEALERLPLIKNTKRIQSNVNTINTNKTHSTDIKNLEKRVKILETQLKDAILDIERLKFKQTKVSKLLTQRDIDGYNSKQENFS